MSVLYQLFADTWKECLDFSDDALLSLYNHESYGTDVSHKNGFAFGKKYLNLQVTAWKEMIYEGTLTRSELYSDPKYSDYHWWLDSVLKNTYSNLTYQDILQRSKIG